MFYFMVYYYYHFFLFSEFITKNIGTNLASNNCKLVTEMRCQNAEVYLTEKTIVSLEFTVHS